MLPAHLEFGLDLDALQFGQACLRLERPRIPQFEIMKAADKPDMAGDAADLLQHRRQHDAAGIIDGVWLGAAEQIGALGIGFGGDGIAVAFVETGLQAIGKLAVKGHQAAAAGVARPHQHLLAARLCGEHVAKARRHRQPALRVNRVQAIAKIIVARHPIPLPRGTAAAALARKSRKRGTAARQIRPLWKTGVSWDFMGANGI